MLHERITAQESENIVYDPYYEFMDRNELHNLQLKRLKKILHHAYTHVEYYRNAYKQAGVSPCMLERLEDISRFPFTVKDNLRDSYPFDMLAVPRQQIVRIHASSGTTGKPTVIGYTSEDINIWSDLMARSMACAGIRPGDIVHNAYNYGLFTGGFGVHYGAERLGCSVIPMSAGNTEKQIMLMKDFGAHVFASTPSYALNVAEKAMSLDVDLATGPLRIGLLGGEPSSEAMRESIESQLGIKVIELYGLSEIMGPGVACECTEQSGLHGWEDRFLFEIIHPETQEILPFGETGELVITTLSKEAQPMIRYRTRDITSLSDEPCSCGRSHVRIMHITGRNDDMLIIRGVNIYPSQVEAALMEVRGLAPHYQLVLRKEGVMDSLHVEVEIDRGCTAGRTELIKAAKQQLKSMLGISCEIEIFSAGQLPRSDGKAVRVRDLRE